MTHTDAPLTPLSRRPAEVIVIHGWMVRRTAERLGLTSDRLKLGRPTPSGEPLIDGSSRPAHSPTQTSRRLERRIIGLRVTRRWGPHRIGYQLRVPRSTVGRVPTRYSMPLLAHLDTAIGLVVRRPRPVRYEHPAPGDLVHCDPRRGHRRPRARHVT